MLIVTKHSLNAFQDRVFFRIVWVVFGWDLEDRWEGLVVVIYLLTNDISDLMNESFLYEF